MSASWAIRWPVPIDAYIGFGGNVGPVARRLGEALERIGGWSFVVGMRLSNLYRTAPVGPVADQPPFLNAVVELSVDVVTAAELFARLAKVETELGREPGIPQGPRVIDLDLLLFGDERVDEPTLVVPHPRIAARAFVLRPLADLLGDDYAGLGKPLRELLAAPAVAAQDISPWVG